MNIKISSNKRIRFDIKNNLDITNNCAFIINTSYPENIDFVEILDRNKIPYIVLVYDDVKSFSSNSFNESIAQDIKDFVDNLFNINTIYISCDAGESRSSAIGCVLMKYYNQDEMIIWKDPHYHPNLFIYSIMCDVFGFNIDENKLKKLQDISDKSLYNAIHNT